MRVRSLFPLALLFAACGAPGPPPVAVETSFGTVRGVTDEAANRVATEIEWLAPRVRDALVDARATGTEVWVVETLRDARGRRAAPAVSGFTRYRNREPVGIHVRAGVNPRWALSHELVHALSGATWDALPGVMHEGLADVVTEGLVPEVRAEVRATRILNASLFLGGLSLRVCWDEPSGQLGRSSAVRVPFAESGRGAEAEGLLTFDRWDLHEETEVVGEALYGLGWLITRRIVDRRGLDGLRALCEEARDGGHTLVPVVQLLAAADLEGADWNAAVSAELGAAEAREIARLLPSLFPSVAVSVLGPPHGRLQVEALFGHLRPRLVVAGGHEVLFEDLPGARREIERRWDP